MRLLPLSSCVVMALTCLAAAPSTTPFLRKAPPLNWKWAYLEKKAEEKDEKVSLPKTDGRIVVVVFFDADRGDGKELCQEIRGISSYLGTKGVVFLGVAKGKNEAGYASLLQNNLIDFPVFFDPKTGAEGMLRQWKVTQTPWVTIVDANGNIVSENVPTAGLNERVLEQIKLTPPRMFDEKLVAAATFEIDIAKRLLAAGNPRGAVRALARVPGELYRSEGIMESYVPISRDLEKAIPGMFTETEQLFEKKKVPEAIVLLEQLKRAMEGSPQMDKVDEQLHSFLDDPDLKAEWEKVKRATEAMDAVQGAKDFESIGDLVSAHAAAGKVVKDFAGTAAAGEAKGLVTRYEADPAQRRKLRDAAFGAKADSMLKAGESYERSNMGAKAKSYYEQIVRDYEGTTAAEKAGEKLKGLK